MLYLRGVFGGFESKEGEKEMCNFTLLVINLKDSLLKEVIESN